MSTITKGATTITPTLVLRNATSAMVGTITHKLIRGGTSYSLRSAEPRTGTLDLFFLDAAAAWACFNLHTEVGVFVYDDTDVTQQSMEYVVTGRVEPVLDDDTRVRWVVSVDYGEII